MNPDFTLIWPLSCLKDGDHFSGARAGLSYTGRWIHGRSSCMFGSSVGAWRVLDVETGGTNETRHAPDTERF